MGKKVNSLSISFPESEFLKHRDQELALALESSDLTIGVLWKEKFGRAQMIFEERPEGNLWPQKTVVLMCDDYEEKEKKEVEFFIFICCSGHLKEERKYITI